jgi:hypothetical protein
MAVHGEWPIEIQHGDYFGVLISTGCYSVSIGRGTQAHAGWVVPVGWWWASFQVFPFSLDQPGDTRPPSLLGYAQTPDEAIRYFTEPPPPEFSPS